MTDNTSPSADSTSDEERPEPSSAGQVSPQTPERPIEIGGVDGPEPTRYGDWERKGRCIDF